MNHLPEFWAVTMWPFISSNWQPVALWTSHPTLHMTPSSKHPNISTSPRHLRSISEATTLSDIPGGRSHSPLLSGPRSRSGMWEMFCLTLCLSGQCLVFLLDYKIAGEKNCALVLLSMTAHRNCSINAWWMEAGVTGPWPQEENSIDLSHSHRLTASPSFCRHHCHLNYRINFL